MEQKANNEDSIWRKILLSREGRVFVIGSCMLILWVSVILTLWRLQHPMWLHVLTMGFTELLIGRAAAIAQATQLGLHPVLIVFLATYVDAMTVFILYPPLVLSCRGLLEREPLGERVKPILEAAQKSVSRFVKFKVAGVFVFVWFPFWMTGVVVGSVLGYLLGLKVWVNMTTVTISTMLAAVCWVVAYDKLYEWLGGLHRGASLVATLLIIITLGAYRFIQERRSQH
jgi:uncharacterized membrane protein